MSKHGSFFFQIFVAFADYLNFNNNVQETVCSLKVTCALNTLCIKPSFREQGDMTTYRDSISDSMQKNPIDYVRYQIFHKEASGSDLAQISEMQETTLII